MADGLVSKTIESLVNGVSQQPDFLRLPSQCSVQDNMMSDVTEGARKRPPLEFVATLHSDELPAEGYHVHFRARNETTQHAVLIENGNIRVFNLLTGAEAVVNIAEGAEDYLTFSGDNAARAFNATSVADFTFIVNKEIVPAMGGDFSPELLNEFLLHWVEPGRTTNPYNWRQILGEVEQNIEFNPEQAEPNQSPTSLVNDLAAQVYNVANFPLWTFSAPGRGILHGVQTSGDFAQIQIPEYDYSDEVYKFITDQAQEFTDLPRYGVDGFTVEITGNDQNENNNYWVKYDAAKLVWVETVGPNINNDLDATTLPHTLVQVGDDEFDFGPAAYLSRLKGDDVTAPEPPFIGVPISDVVFHKNRLCFLSGEDITMSESGEYFNFWPTTVTTLIDSDPIYAAGTNNRIAPLDFGVPFDQKLYLFSSVGGLQNVMIGGDSLTNENAEIVEASAFPSSPLVRPQSIGKAVYFVVDVGTASEVREYTIADLVADADNITPHLPTYIPANVSSFTASSKKSMLAMASPNAPSSIFINSFFFAGKRKLQNAWSKWELGTDITLLGLGWVDEGLHLIIEMAGAVHLAHFDLASLADGDLAHRVYLDLLFSADGSFEETTGVTSWAAPYVPDDGEFRAVLSDSDAGDRFGATFAVEYDADAETFTAAGDFGGIPAHIGRWFDTDFEFTKLFLFSKTGADAAAIDPITQGRLQIRNFALFVRDSAGFEARVSSSEIGEDDQLSDEDEFIYSYPEKIIDSTTIGQATRPAADRFMFDVGMESRHARIRITSRSHLPLNINGGEWTGYYVAHATRT